MSVDTWNGAEPGRDAPVGVQMPDELLPVAIKTQMPLDPVYSYIYEFPLDETAETVGVWT
jgi:hypothetical protein